MEYSNKFNELIESWIDFAKSEFKIKDKLLIESIKALSEEIYKYSCEDNEKEILN